MKKHQFCPSPHITAEELDGDTTVTVQRAVIEEVGTDKEEKGVLYLKEFGKRGFVVNQTNWNRIESHHGDDTDLWLGKQITLYPTTCDFRGKSVACIRVRGKDD